MAKQIRNLEIFGAGKHRAATGGITVTEEDLDHIVDAFTALHGTNVVKPHLKLGHTDAQKWFGQKDGIPTLGWITRVWRNGLKLLADIDNVPEALIELIEQKRFHNVSAEVFWDAPIEHNGRRFPRVLSAVSLLGVEMPAVKDLAGLASALFQTEPAHQFTEGDALSLEFEEEDPMPDPDNKTPVVAMFSQEQVDALIAAAVAKATGETEKKFTESAESSTKELEVMTKRATDAEEALTTAKADVVKAAAEALVDGAIKEGKLLPKQRDFALAALSVTDTKVKFGDKGEEKTMAESFKDFLEAQGKVIDTSQKGDGKNKQVEFASASEEVDYKTKEIMKGDAKLTYSDAFDRVLDSDDDLRTRYAA